MINVMENKVLGPMIQQQFEKGRMQGHQEILVEQLTEKFGALPDWAVQRIQSGSADEVHEWVKRVLRSTSLEDTLR